jgi:hypothetical protein
LVDCYERCQQKLWRNERQVKGKRHYVNAFIAQGGFDTRRWPGILPGVGKVPVLQISDWLATNENDLGGQLREGIAGAGCKGQFA